MQDAGTPRDTDDPKKQQLPPGWVRVEKASSTGKKYVRYQSPDGALAQSVSAAWKRVGAASEVAEPQAADPDQERALLSKDAAPDHQGAPKSKKARRATGVLRKWSIEEEERLRALVATLTGAKPRRADFDGFASQLNDWALQAALPGSPRTGYAVEQRWLLYLAPGAPRADKAATTPAPASLPVVEIGRAHV